MPELITESYKVGGLTLVSLGLLAFFCYMMLRFVFKRMDTQDKRIAQVEGDKSKLAEGVIKDNTTALHAVVHACDRQTTAFSQLVIVLGERPCFDQQQPKVVPPVYRKHRTPLPGTIRDNP